MMRIKMVPYSQPKQQKKYFSALRAGFLSLLAYPLSPFKNIIILAEKAF